MRPSRVMRLPPRERILDAAEDMFFHEGIRRVSVDAIAARAETTKAAVYRHFGSKEALVQEWLRIVTAQHAEAQDRLAAEHPDDPEAQILGHVRDVIEGLGAASYRGCPFINSLAELPDVADPARAIIEAHKARQAERMLSLCRRIGLRDPEAAAAHVTFVLEGAQVSAQNGSIRDAGRFVRTAIAAILDDREGVRPSSRTAPSAAAVRRERNAGP